VAITASGRTARTSSGRISGTGLASAKTSGSAAIFFTISGFSTPGADKPKKISAPLDDIGETPVAGFLGVTRLALIHQLLAALIDHAGDVGHRDMSHGQAEVDQQIEAGQCRGPGTRRHQPHLVNGLADDAQAVEHRGGDDDRGAMLIVMEYGNVHALAQGAFHLETFRRLDILEVDGAEGGAPGWR